MKLPALVISVAVAAGILAGGVSAALPPRTALLCLAAAFVFLAAGALCAARNRLLLGWCSSLLVWALLGAAAAQFATRATPADNAARLAAAGKIDLSQPLRWRGRLHSDPLQLPWGARYDVDLEQVEAYGRWIPVSGGLRASYYFNERAADPPAESVRAGDSVELLARARAVRNFADPGAFDYRTFLARQGIFLTASLRSTELLQKLTGPAPGLRYRLSRVHGNLLGETDSLLAGSPQAASVARAMLLGDRSFLDREEVEPFRQTGAYHVLVLAGLHVGVLVAVLLWLGRTIRLPLVARTLLALAVLAAYVAIVEDRPPILRAALMAAVYLLGRLLFRRTALLNSIGVAALAILLLNPSELRDPSFQLSFLAAGVIGGIAAPWLERTAERYRHGLHALGDVTRDRAHAPSVAQFRLDARAASNWLASRLPHGLSRFATTAVTLPCRIGLRLWELAVLSFVLQLGMLPLMAQDFHRVTLAGPLSNVPAVVLTGMIVPVGFAALGAGLIWHAFGRLLGQLLILLIHALVASVGWFSRWTWASYGVPSPPVLLLVAFFIAAAVFSAAIFGAKRWPARASGAALLIFAAGIAAYPFAPRLQRGRLEVTVLDVGQGDSIFAAFPDGRTMLVDGGGLPGSFYAQGVRSGIDVGEDVVSPFLWTRGLKTIDVVALTHPHEDHIGGLAAVLRNFRVEELWLGRDVDTPAYRSLLAEARDRGVRVVHRRRGDAFDWGGVRLGILWPPGDDSAAEAHNDDSLVLRLTDGSESALLTGDIEKPVERDLLADADSLPADFLKVPHHGSKTSSTQPFLDAVHPRFAVISVGEANPYGHPNAEVVGRLSAEGARLYRTDQDGAITLLTDGRAVELRSFLDPR